MTLKELQQLGKKSRRRTISSMSKDEKLKLVDEIIDRDAATWKEYNRLVDCDFTYYFRFIDGGIALTERQR